MDEKKKLGKPQSDSEVINKHPSTLLVGYGWVGQHIGKYFKEAHWTDESGEYRTVDNELVKPKDKYDLGFISVPTPMGENGRCDTSTIDTVIEKHGKLFGNPNKVSVDNWCNKSTVEVGTIDRLKKQYGINICMSPEYVGETLGHPLLEAKPDPFIILGGDKETTRKFADAWTKVTNSYARIHQTDGKTAELTKLMENSYIATKVMFVNEFRNLAESIGVDYNELRELWLADPRVSRSHTYAYDDNKGFAGKCLPKDLTNLATYFREEVGNPAHMIEFLLKRNEEIRGKKK